MVPTHKHCFSLLKHVDYIGRRRLEIKHKQNGILSI